MKQAGKPSETIGKYDTIPKRPEDQMQANGGNRAPQRAKEKGTAPD